MENDTVSEWVVAERSLKILLKSCAEPRASRVLIRVRTTTWSTYSGGGTKYFVKGMSTISPKILRSVSVA